MVIEMGRKKVGGRVVSVRVDEELWREFRVYCVSYKLKTGEVVSDLIRQKLKETRK